MHESVWLTLWIRLFWRLLETNGKTNRQISKLYKWLSKKDETANSLNMTIPSLNFDFCLEFCLLIDYYMIKGSVLKYERGYRFTSKRIRWWSNKFTVAGNPECNSVQLSLKSHPLWVTLYIDVNEKWWQTSNPSLRDISPSELIILYISRNVLIPILGLLFGKIFIFNLIFSKK